LYFRKTNIYVLQMKKNYNSLPRGAGNFLPPPGSNSKAFACWLSNHFKGKNLLVATFLFMLSAVQMFAQSGETCETAVDLGTLTSPFTGSTVGAANDYTPPCGASDAAPDLVYSIVVPNGYTLNIGQVSNIGVDANGNPINYDSINTVYYGVCGTLTQIGVCRDDPDTPLDGEGSQVEWENTTGSTQTVYWYQDGYNQLTGTRVSEGEFVLQWTLTPPPTCNIPTAVTAALTSATAANLSWGAPITGTVTGYEYALTNSEVPPASGTATTATSINGVAITTNQNTYLHVRANCGATDGYSTWVTYPFYSGICIPSSFYVGGTGIANVAIGSINNTTGLEATNYGNYSSQIVNIGQGVTQMFSVTFNTFDSMNVKFWVDWNDNLTFDENEEVYSGVSSGTANTALNGTFTVPATAALGNHRLRIGGVISWNGEPTPCSTDVYYSVFEDYTVNVTVPPTCFTPVSPTAVNVSAGSINIAWSMPTLGTAPAGYEYAVDTNVAAPASGTAITATSVNNVAVTINVPGYLHVRTNCGSGDYSEWVTIPFYNGVCIPSPINVDGQGITNVTIGSINNTTGDETNHYGDYTAQVVNIGQGVTYPFSITYSTSGADYVTRIWADWNDDLDFDDEGEEIFFGTSTQGAIPAILSGTFTVPVTASLGNHRMRIGGTDSGPTTPCYNGSWGSYEDYTINVTIPPTCFTPATPLGVATASGLANLSWVAPTLGGAPVGYEYVVDTNVASPASGTATTATSITGYTGIVDNTYYYLHVRTNCGTGDFSEWVTSRAFRFLQGDTCNTAISLDNLTSPLSSSTVGAADEFLGECNYGSSPDLYYSITVPNGYVLVAGLDESNYSTGTTLYYGNCEEQTEISCRIFSNDSTTWENTTGSTQTVYWVQDGYYGGAGEFTLAWTLTPPPPCNIPRNVIGTMVTRTTANLSWTVPITGNPISYEYALTQSETPPASGTVTTSLSFTGVTSVANAYNYLHVRTNCGPDGYSEWVTYKFYSGHCIPATTDGTYNNIINFTTTTGFSNINNVEEQFEPYANNFDTMVVSQEPGGSFGYTVTIDSYSQVEIWVDWNDDLDFDDEGEDIATYSNQNFTDGVFTGTISIPGVIAQGNYRMRVRSGSVWSTGSPCGDYYSGSAQDYAINIGDPPTCYVPINVAGIATAPGTANLSWASQGLGSAPVGYEYFVTTSTTSPESGTVITGTSVTGYTGLIDNTWYYLHVRTNCGDGDYSQWAISPRFRYLAGDTCASAVNLTSQTSPYSYSTVGAANDYTSTCNTNGTAPDLFYSFTVPNGYTLTVGLTASGYDSVHSLFYGNCDTQSYIDCTDNETGDITWENISGSTQTVYWVQDGWNVQSGTFTLAWTLTPPPTCDKPRNLDVNITSLTTTDISWILPNTGTAVGYEYAVTTSATPPESGIATTATSITEVAVTPNVDSYLHVRTICSEADGNSIWITLPFFSGYCVPKNTQYPAYYITGITTTGGETNINSTSTGFSAFTDYTATHSVTTYPGGTFDIQATTPNTTDQFVFSVWIDWNNNFDFSDDGERIFSSSLIRTPAEIGNVVIPMDAALGSYRMRIRNTRFGSPVPVCGEASGEAEDYTLIVAATPTCLPPYISSISPTDVGYANLNWSPSFLGNPASSFEYVFGPSSTPPAAGVSGTPVEGTFAGDVEYNPELSVYLFIRSNCGNGDYSSWSEPSSILGTDSSDFLSNSVIVYKEGAAINITSGSTLMKGVTIYDTRGRKLYSQADINNTEVALTGLQIQQQVVIVEITTARGKVSKRIVF